MTDEELDVFFIQTLKNILSDMKDCKAYVKDLHSPEYDEINQDYDEVIQDVEGLIKELKTIDDLALLDEETITAVYDYIDSYAENFIIHTEEGQKQKDLEEYSKLEELLNLFIDTDDFEDEEI